MTQLQPTPEQMAALSSFRAIVEGYPQGGQIERHVHDMDQLALISQSTAIIETDEAYVVHPLLKAVWIPAGIHHSVYSSRPFYLHSLYFEAGSVRSATRAEVLGLDPLSRELLLFLCSAPRPSQRGVRHAHALALLIATLADAKVESFSLPRPHSERARKLADYLAACPDDNRSLEQIAAEIGGASLRTFERMFTDETGLSLAVWRRQSRLLTSLTLLAQGKSVGVVARAVGYESTAAFSAAFKQCFGTAPTSYALTENTRKTP